MRAIDRLDQLPEEVLELMLLWLREELHDAERDTIEKASTAAIDKVRLAAGGADKVRELLKKTEVIYERKRNGDQPT